MLNPKLNSIHTFGVSIIIGKANPPLALLVTPCTTVNLGFRRKKLFSQHFVQIFKILLYDNKTYFRDLATSMKINNFCQLKKSKYGSSQCKSELCKVEILTKMAFLIYTTSFQFFAICHLSIITNDLKLCTNDFYPVSHHKKKVRVI